MPKARSRSVTTESSARSRAMAKPILCAMVEAPTPPLAPTTAMMRPTGLASGRREQPADRAHDVDGADRRDQIVADAAPRQLAVERHVVDAADHDHARAGVADFGQVVEPGEDIVGAVFRFDDDDVGRRRAAIGFDRGGGAAHLDFHMRLGEPAVFARRLHGGGGFHRLAEGLHRHPRRGRDMLVGGDRLGRRRRRRFMFGECDLLGVFYHFPRSLILALS